MSCWQERGCNYTCVWEAAISWEEFYRLDGHFYGGADNHVIQRVMGKMHVNRMDQGAGRLRSAVSYFYYHNKYLRCQK